MSYFKHETAIIDDGAQIGSGSKIWHFSHVMPGAILGEACNIGQNVFIASKVKLGDNCKVQNNVSLYEGVECGNNVFLGPSAVFTNVINPRSQVSRKTEYKKTLIKDGASIGANATIVCGVTIGYYAFVGAGTVVTRDLPDYALFVGNPGKQVGWMSRNGQRLHFNSNGKALCSETGEAYALAENSKCILADN